MEHEHANLDESMLELIENAELLEIANLRLKEKDQAIRINLEDL